MGRLSIQFAEDEETDEMNVVLMACQPQNEFKNRHEGGYKTGFDREANEPCNGTRGLLELGSVICPSQLKCHEKNFKGSISGLTTMTITRVMRTSHAALPASQAWMRLLIRNYGGLGSKLTLITGVRANSLSMPRPSMDTLIP